MPKKKVQHKGKPKQATLESEDFIFRKNDSEDTEDEYVTVANYETNKYKPRLLKSNWAKYESSVSDSPDGESEVPKTNDFNYLLQTASSDCSHFEFNSEKLWKSENKAVTSKIFDLDLNFLSSGLACVPFYERMGLNEREVPIQDKKRFDEEAENSWKQYNLAMGKSSIKTDDDVKNKDVEDNKTNDNVILDKNKKEVETSKVENTKNEVEKSKGKNNLFNSDENLEDWLDSILDD